MLSSTRSLWESNDQHVAGLELQQSCSWSGGEQREEEEGGEQRLTPLGFSNKPALCS